MNAKAIPALYLLTFLLLLLLLSAASDKKLSSTSRLHDWLGIKSS